MSDLMKRKHQFRLMELEESVLLAQVNALHCWRTISNVLRLRNGRVFGLGPDRSVKCHAECLSVR